MAQVLSNRRRNLTYFIHQYIEEIQEKKKIFQFLEDREENQGFFIFFFFFQDYDMLRMNYLVLNYAGKDTGGIISLICFISLLWQNKI